MGLSAKYGWQALFNTFGALAIAAESYGLKGAVGLRVIRNVFWRCICINILCYVLLAYVGKKETAVTVDAEFLMKVLGNPEMAALLTSLAKSLKVE